MRPIHVSQLVRSEFRGIDLTAVLRRLGTKQESCGACAAPIGKKTPTNLAVIRHRESKRQWPALLHTGCGSSAVYETSAAPDENKSYFEIECAFMVGQRGPVPALILDAYGGFTLTPQGEMHDSLLAQLTRVGFEFPDWFDREGTPGVEFIDEDATVDGLTAEFKGGVMNISHRGVAVFRLPNLNYFPRWYRALGCGVLFVAVGRNLQGMTWQSLDFIQKAAAKKDLVAALAAATIAAPDSGSSCTCVNGSQRRFQDCCGDPHGPEE